MRPKRALVVLTVLSNFEIKFVSVIFLKGSKVQKRTFVLETDKIVVHATDLYF
jgi:hypothetical protein